MGNRRQSWPYLGQAASPVALTQTPDALLNSGRSLAGPLRLGTAPGVGPKDASRNGPSDLGMDRVSPRRFDPMGTDCERWPRASSSLISEHRRR